jgi:hypothetical protein
MALITNRSNLRWVFCGESKSKDNFKNRSIYMIDGYYIDSSGLMGEISPYSKKRRDAPSSRFSEREKTAH